MTETADTFEVSPQQEALWLTEPGGPSGRVQATLSLRGPLESAAVSAALRRTVERHEILRTRFVHREGIRVPLQAVGDELAPAFSTVDLSEHDPDAQQEQIDAIAAEELAHQLDFARGPLVRALLAKLGGERHLLLLTFSSLCADASSATLVARDVVDQLAGGESLVEDPLQYADFAAWQRELQGSDDAEAATARAFWKDAAATTAAPIPFARPGSPPGARRRFDIGLDPRLVGELSDQAARYGASPADIAHAAWHAVLARSAGEDWVATTLFAADRRHDDLAGAVGAFARPVPVRTELRPGISFAEVLAAVAHDSHEATVWQDYAPAGAPALPIGFVCSDAYGASASAGALEASLQRVTVTEPSLRLWLTCLTGEGELALSLDYDEAFLAREHAERLGRRLRRLLESIAQDAGTRLSDLAILDDDERTLLLETFNAGGAANTAGSVHGLFSAHAAAAGERDAVVDEHGAVTYGELERRANQLANRLRRAGVGPDVAVGLCTDRSVDMVVGLLGILKAGGAYVPLHYEHPQARLGHQLTTAGARAIVTQEPVLPHLPEFDGEVICLDRDRRELDAQDASAPEVPVSAENLVYIIYTSGSTGTPKGVGVTHGNLVNYATDIARRLGADGAPLAFGVVTSISTDLGNTSIFGALCSGGTLVLVSPIAAADAGAFVRQVERTPIDVLKITPSHLGALIAGSDGRVLPRERLVIGGERATWDLVARVRKLNPGCRILNHYGPTEATVGCCTFAVGDGPGEYEPATVPIGGPIAGARSYVLDERGEPAPLGAPGRLHIGGAGVARGYVGAPELTAERFVEDPFAEGRMYDTGDLARWLPDGTLEFLGRVDEQVKIRGYRVEPAEVESALRSHAGVREAVVVTRTGAAGDTRLIAYCAAADGVSPDELKAHLAQWLPEFMVPSAIVTLDGLPQTPSGKIDRLALPDPDEVGDSTEYVAPRTPVEQAVAEIWAHVLGVAQVGVQDDFFALGGHSLLATQVVAQVRSDFAVELPLHSLFTHPTVATLASEIVRMMGDSEEETAELMAELEGLSDEEAERLLAGEAPPADA